MLVGGLAVVAVLLLAGCSSAQPVGAGTAAPTDDATPSASATPTATPSDTPERARPVSLVGIGCEELVPLAELENVVGDGTVLVDPTGEQANAWSATHASFAYAGGLYCRWSDSMGQYRAMASVTPNATAAAEQIAAEFETDPALEELSSWCSIDGCRATGFVGDFHVTIAAVPEQPDGADSAMTQLRKATYGVLVALPPVAALPPLSALWGDAPGSCAELLPAEQLGIAANVDSLTYSPGYAYEDSSGSDHALLTAGGFACRYWPGDSSGNGSIRVLPDAAPALQQVQAVAPESESVVIDGVPDGAATVECSSNGEPAWSAGSTGVCTVHVPARGAWVTVVASGTGDVRVAIIERAQLLTAAVVAALV